MRQPTRNTTAWWHVNFLVILLAVNVAFRKTYALQSLSLAASDKGSNYHRYKPPVKTSVLKQLIQSRSLSSNGGNGRGKSQTDIGPTNNNASTTRPNRPSTAHLAFSGTIPLPPQSLKQRIRNKILGNSQQSQNEERQPNNTVARNNQRRPANVQMIETLQQYKIIVGDEPHKIVAVRFYATYCKACHAAAPHFYHLATNYPDAIFIDVPVKESNASLHQGLGVQTLPYAHIYHPLAGLVEEQKLTRNHFRSFKAKLNSYIAGSCPISFGDNINCEQNDSER